LSGLKNRDGLNNFLEPLEWSKTPEVGGKARRRRAKKQITHSERYATFRSGRGRFGYGTFRYGHFRLGHFGRDISVDRQVIIFVYLNGYIGRRNTTLAGVIPTPFDVDKTVSQVKCHASRYYTQWRF